MAGPASGLKECQASLKTFNHAGNQMGDVQFQSILIIVKFHSIIAYICETSSI